jgi:hypothetical protein
VPRPNRRTDGLSLPACFCFHLYFRLSAIIGLTVAGAQGSARGLSARGRGSAGLRLPLLGGRQTEVHFGNWTDRPPGSTRQRRSCPTDPASGERPDGDRRGGTLPTCAHRMGRERPPWRPRSQAAKAAGERLFGQSPRALLRWALESMPWMGRTVRSLHRPPPDQARGNLRLTEFGLAAIRRCGLRHGHAPRRFPGPE